MTTILDSIKGLITPNLISKAASFLGEDESGVTKAVTSLVPSLLGSVLAKGNSPALESALHQAGKENSSILENMVGTFSGETHTTHSSLGTNFLSSLLGDKLEGFTSTISSVSGISSNSSNKLTSMVAPVVAGFLGNKLSSGSLDLSGLLSLLNKEKSSFLNLIPSGLGSLFGLSSLSNLDNSISSKVHNVEDVTARVAKKDMGWLKWVLGLVVLGILAFYLFRTCNAKEVKDTITSTTTVIDEAKDKVGTIDKVSVNLSLPDGLELTAFKGGIEDQMIIFLNSDAFKDATEETLKEKWFDFDNIEFKYGSATELTDKSANQLQNIVSILKYYKDTKIKIGGYTDKTGNPEANMKLSQERANTIKATLEKGGIAASRLSAEGYGDQFAKYAPDAPDADRAHDRKISLRFEK